MKKMMLLVIVALVPVLLGVDRCQIKNDEAMLTAVQLGGYNLGVYVASEKLDQFDVAIRDAYVFARDGKLSPEDMAKALRELKLNNPLLVGNLTILLTNMGATFTAGDTLESIAGIPPEYWDRAKDGYLMGYAMGKAEVVRLMQLPPAPGGAK
jgi:hypothetical protein